MIKQYNSAFKKEPYKAIQTDGCLYNVLLKAAENITGEEFTVEEIKRIWHYSIPDYMEDHRHPNKDRCYIRAGGHVEIIRLGLHVLGVRHATIQYKYRYDINTEKYILGNKDSLCDCNFFFAKCKLPAYNHFYESDREGELRWNPGYSFSHNLLSIRGVKITI